MGLRKMVAMSMQNEAPVRLTEVAREAWQLYLQQLTREGAGGAGGGWWECVVLTASSPRQAAFYRQEIQRRQGDGKLPRFTKFLVVPDAGGRRMGSGGATLHAIRTLVDQLYPDAVEEAWWARHRVLIIHSGGDSKRLPAYSVSGKLFGILPFSTPWGDVNTVFDQMMALSTAWAGRVPGGLVVSSGDVVLTFDAAELDWSREGVSGAAMVVPFETGAQHGVYVLNEGRVYSFLQKPSREQTWAAGGLLEREQVAVDTGLLRFDAPLTAALARLAISTQEIPEIDLYEDMTLALTGQSRKRPGSHFTARLLELLKQRPFWCSLVQGDFTHIGSTAAFRRLIAEDNEFKRTFALTPLADSQAGMGAGVILDSVLAEGSRVAPGAIALECELEQSLRLRPRAIAQGLTRLDRAAEIPEDTVVHEVPVLLPDGRRASVLRLYGTNDNPKDHPPSWLNRPMAQMLEVLGIAPEEVWPDAAAAERTLWNAQLFPAGEPARLWAGLRWMLGEESPYSVEEWRAAERLSLEQSARWADNESLAHAGSLRRQSQWRRTVLAVAAAESDLRPLLANAPGLPQLAGTGRALEAAGRGVEQERPTTAASRHYQAGLFYAQAGMRTESEAARARAFESVREGVERGVALGSELALPPWRHEGVRVTAPIRVDMGGGWSDTPPFCLDWGGIVLNLAIELDGRRAIGASARRLREPVVRCIAGADRAEWRSMEELLAPQALTSLWAVPLQALRLGGLIRPGENLRSVLERQGGGVEIETSMNLPLGSGLGTSSILSAAVVRALAALSGLDTPNEQIVDVVLRLEQAMTTGGGWQDQAGGIWPGAKIVSSSPGLRQRLRVKPIHWDAEREREFLERFVLYFTGIRRVAKGLLEQVVGRYLAREANALMVLHNIKSLAIEMSYAMEEGAWEELGGLLDRHWQFNQILDPHTTNAPINALLERCRPYLAGAKLAGAGGGGFMMLLARDAEAAGRLRKLLAAEENPHAAVYPSALSHHGLTVERLEQEAAG
jgi:fucokinase